MIVFSSFLTDCTKEIDFIPDYYEYRLDLSHNMFYISDFYKDKPTILTLRDIDEGGKYSSDLDDKINFLSNQIIKDNFYADIELKHSQVISDSLIHKVILSYHDYSSQPLDNLKLVLKDISYRDCFFYKFVFKIDKYHDLVEIYKILSNSKIKFCLLSTGKLSLLSRVLYKHFGSCATYIGKSGHTTASNQMTEQDMKIFNLLSINKQTRITGILGGDQVLKSLGLTFYNQRFSESGIDKVYLPFVCEDLNDFLYILKSSLIRIEIISVTMPFKRKLADYLQLDKPLNLWDIDNNEFYLTDEDAVVKSIEKALALDITAFIILGYGVMATLFLKHLKNYQVKIIGRDNFCITHLSTHYNLKNKIDDDAKICFINTTPLGSNNESILEYVKEQIFDFAIDLPYAENDTELVKICNSKDIPFIDGKQFWMWQAKKQLRILLNDD